MLSNINGGVNMIANAIATH